MTAIEEGKTIYLAGGCFWGLEAYLQRLSGVMRTEVGYANGRTTEPTYEAVCHERTGHAETVRVTYDPHILPLTALLEPDSSWSPRAPRAVFPRVS